jgi:hypothetical protein
MYYSMIKFILGITALFLPKIATANIDTIVVDSSINIGWQYPPHPTLYVFQKNSDIVFMDIRIGPGWNRELEISQVNDFSKPIPLPWIPTRDKVYAVPILGSNGPCVGALEIFGNSSVSWRAGGFSIDIGECTKPTIPSNIYISWLIS